MNTKQTVFLEEYLRTFNAAAAARAAGYAPTNARDRGYRLLQMPHMQAAVKERLAELQMQSEEVLTRLTAMARADMLDFINEDGAFDMDKVRAAGFGRLIKKYKLNRRTIVQREGPPIIEDQLEIELHDAQSALVHLGRSMALFTDKVAGSVEVNYDDLAAELDRRIAGLAQRSGAPSNSGPVQPASES